MGLTGMIYGLTVAGAAVLSAVGVLVGARTIAEGARALRETRRRQRLLHPDPEAERAAVEKALLTGREVARAQMIVDALAVQEVV